MLRRLLLVLLLANLLYAAWTAGHLRNFGLEPASPSEPQRLAQQIEPQAVRVLPREQAAALEASVRGTQCLTAGPLAAAQEAPLRERLAGWPLGSWVLERDPPGLMLRLPVVDEALRARLAELQPLLGALSWQPCR